MLGVGCWFLFVFGSVLVAVPCFREASKEESLKFELTVILNFDQNLESEFVFKRIIGIGRGVPEPPPF